MHAIIFDIDGTLLDSDVIDAELYVAAVRHVLGDVRIRGGWGEYEYVTDTGILGSILDDNGIDRGDHVVESVRTEFLRRVREHVHANGPFSEIPGARDFVLSLGAAPDRAFAYATGGWGVTAALKLDGAGFPLEGVPLISSDDASDRCQIMLKALHALGSGFASVTYYGDGEWDRDAALGLGWDFVAVGAKLRGIERYRAPSGRPPGLPGIEDP
jgi:beta-phosphoglucomutase-like phosphatase (HAD superfamily)